MNALHSSARRALPVIVLTWAFVWSAAAQSPCVNGLAAGLYPCDNIDLLSTMGTNQVGGGDMNDIWGWTDPLDGKEYVLLGRTNGTASLTFQTRSTCLPRQPQHQHGVVVVA